MARRIPKPSEGRLTFDAEGQEGGTYHSRHLHVPSSNSGLTIGRGYDMKLRSRSEVRDDLVDSGVNPIEAALISQAAGMKGERAEEFLAENELEDFEITPRVQLKLFEIEYKRQAADARRLATKADVTRAYGKTNWDRLHPVIREVLVDLRFRGDYTPSCRKFLQAHVANNDVEAFVREVTNPQRWPNVPSDRFGRRKAICETIAV